MNSRAFPFLLYAALLVVWTGCASDSASETRLTPCLDTLNDPLHCGDCGNECEPGDACQVGACVDICGGTLGACFGACVSLTSDPNHCGACGQRCGAGESCSQGVCTASCALTQCATATPGVLACADLNSESAHCGVCDNRCDADRLCVAGVCRLDCAFGLNDCDDACVDLLSTQEHCGACGNPCGDTFRCAAGTCQCDAGQTECTDVCADLQTDVNHCGVCDNACPESFLCAAGTCVCAMGEIDCGGACVDTQVDDANCGMCGSQCEGGSSCVLGECLCPEGQEQCDGQCVDTSRDSQNCGACGNVCGSLDACDNGTCIGEDDCPSRLVSGLELSEMAVFQGVKVPIVLKQEGELTEVADRNADVVQERNAVFRVYVEPTPDWEAREVSARVVIQQPDDPLGRLFYTKKVITQPSRDEDADSTFQVDVPADALVEGARYSLSLVECTIDAAGEPSSLACFPQEGESELQAVRTGPIKVRLFPIRTQERPAPELPEEALAAYRERIEAIFPVTGVELTVGEELNGNGGMCNHLGVLQAKRSEDEAPPDVYYYGLTDGPSGNTSGCSALSDDPSESESRVSAGIASGRESGFPRGASTMCHELGHAAGRAHADCGGAAGPDRDFPYEDADIGVWGYDHRDQSFRPPTSKDMMSYCPRNDRIAAWLSDYTYQGLLERIAAVNRMADEYVPRSGEKVAWRILTVQGEQTSWTEAPLWVIGKPAGQELPAVIYDDAGVAITTLTVYRVAIDDGPHPESFMLTVPEPHAGWSTIVAQGTVPTQF